MSNENLVSLPARLRRVERRQEGAGALKVLGQDETEALSNVAALSGDIEMGALLWVVGEEGAEDGEVERA